MKNPLFWSVIEYSLCIFFVLFPFTNSKYFLYGGTSVRAVILILLVSVLGILFTMHVFKRDTVVSVPKSLVLFSVLIYLISVSASGFIGLDFKTSLWSVVTRMTGIWYFLNLGLLMFFLWSILSRQLHNKKIILSILLPMAVYSILSLMGPEGLGWVFKGYQSDGFTFGNSSFAGMYIFGSFLLSIYYLLQAIEKKWWMYVLPVVLVINPNIINRGVWSGDFSGGFVGEARASAYVIFFSIFALVTVWMISKIKIRKIKIAVVYSLFGLSLFVGALSTFSLLSHDGFLRKMYLNQATAARPIVWEMSEKSIFERPFFGWGTDNFERVFELHYDNRLLQDENGNEAWFDRAHNVFIDQAIDNGIVGLTFYILAYLVILLSLVQVFLFSGDKNDRMFASILLVYFPLHFIELQTAFDTTISYPLFAFMTVCAAVLYGRTISAQKSKTTEWVVGMKTKYVLAVLLLGFCSWSFVAGWYPFVRAEIANGYIRTVGLPEDRIPAYEDLFGSTVDNHAFLWRSSTDFQRGIAANPSVLDKPEKVQGLKKEIVVLENAYRDYIKNNPNSFRPRLNLADVLIYQGLFGVDKLKEAQSVLDDAIVLVPQSPQPYWMKAVGYVYMKNFPLAREYAKKALALNPKITQSQKVVKYVEDSIKTFPEIDLFFFSQI